MAEIAIYKHKVTGDLITYTGNKLLTCTYPQLLLMVTVVGWNLSQIRQFPDQNVYKWNYYRTLLRPKKHGVKKS